MRSTIRLRSQMARLDALMDDAARFVKAGDPDDCGHHPSGHHRAGKFTPGNTCASMRGSRGPHPASRRAAATPAPAAVRPASPPAKTPRPEGRQDPPTLTARRAEVQGRLFGGGRSAASPGTPQAAPRKPKPPASAAPAPAAAAPAPRQSLAQVKAEAGRRALDRPTTDPTVRRRAEAFVRNWLSAASTTPLGQIRDEIEETREPNLWPEHVRPYLPLVRGMMESVLRAREAGKTGGDFDLEWENSEPIPPSPDAPAPAPQSSPEPPAREPESTPGDRYVPKYVKARANVDEVARNLFGRNVTPEEMGSITGIAAAAGHVPGGEVHVSTNRSGNEITVSYEVRDKISIDRKISRDDDGNLFVYNALFQIYDDDLKGKGIGVDVFSSEIDEAIKEGMSYVKCYAAGSYSASQREGEDQWIGYYVWPLFGYQRHVNLYEFSRMPDDRAFDSLSQILGRSKSDIVSTGFEISDIIRSKEGKKWWGLHGEGGSMKFDLSPGSLSREILSEYRKEKGIDPKEGPNRFRMARFARPKPVACMAGKFYRSSSGWALLQVPNKLVQGIFDAIREPGIALPPQDSDSDRYRLNAHISVMRPEEIEAAGGASKISEWGHHFHYQIGPIMAVDPEGWDAMERAYFVEVESPELEELRAKYGLSRLPNKNKYKFHITCAVKPSKWSEKYRFIRRNGRPSRFVKAGSPEDCGHRTDGGHFDRGNTCAASRGTRDKDDTGQSARPDIASSARSTRETKQAELVAGAYDRIKNVYENVPLLFYKQHIRAVASDLRDAHDRMKGGEDESRDLGRAAGRLRLLARDMKEAVGGDLIREAYEMASEAADMGHEARRGLGLKSGSMEIQQGLFGDRPRSRPSEPPAAAREPEVEAKPTPDVPAAPAPNPPQESKAESPQPRPGRRGRAAERARELRQRRNVERAPEKFAKPGEYADVKTSEIHFDPERFQYKLGHAAGTGSVGSLAGVQKYDHELAGAISVWRDPADGKVYVVNGHNRLDLAKRLGEEKVHVKFLKAANAEEAKAKGAITNIAEGRGTSMDAAKFFRSTQLGREDIAAMGVPLREKVASEGLDLAKLEDGLFQKVIDGDLSTARAAIIGGSGLSHAQQKDLYNQLQSMGRRGEVTNRDLKELVDNAKAAGSRIKEGFDLFGPHQEEQSLAIYRSRVQGAIKDELMRDRRLFGLVSRSRSAQELAERGRSNIDVETTGRLSNEAAGLLGVFDTLKNRSGPVSQALNRAAERIANGEQQRTVVRDARAEIARAIEEFFGGGGSQAGAA